MEITSPAGPAPHAGPVSSTGSVPYAGPVPYAGLTALVGRDDAVAEVRADIDLAPALRLTLPDEEVRLWRPEDPHLYGLDVALLDAGGDGITSRAA